MSSASTSRVTATTIQVELDSLKAPFPALPVELIRDIFEIAALSCTKTARTLTLVSRFVHQWIDPYLFSTVAIPTLPAGERLAEIFASKPPSFFACGPIRNLSFTAADWALDTCEPVFKAIAKGVQNLSIHGGASNFETCGTSSLHAMRPKRVTIQSFASYAKFQAPLFGSVTHLRILNTSPDLIQIDDIIKGCPMLTHFSFVVTEIWGRGRQVAQLLNRILPAAPLLKEVVVEVIRPPSGGRGFEAEVWRVGGIKDPRVKVIEGSAGYIGVKGWEAEARGGEDIWEKVQRVGNVLDRLDA